MIRPIDADAGESYTPDELVRIRRMLLTAGQYVDCPRCKSDVTLAYRGAHTDTRAYYLLQCRVCGCSVTIADLPEGIPPA
jgi:hypothetical protein